MRERALALPCPIFMFSHVVAAPAASEPSLVLQGAVNELGVNDSVDGEVAEFLQARNEDVQFRERTVVARHAISVPATDDVQHSVCWSCVEPLNRSLGRVRNPRNL